MTTVVEELPREDETTSQRILRFLEIDDSWAVPVLDANPTVAVRSLRADAAVRRLYAGRGPVWRALRGALTAMVPDRARRGLSRTLRRRVVYGGPPPADQAFMLELQRRFKPEVAALSEYLQRDLIKLWGYDALD